jgi:hypothetical protein
LFGANGTGAVLRTADGAEEDGMGGFGRGEGFVGEGLAVGVYGALVFRRSMVNMLWVECV